MKRCKAKRYDGFGCGSYAFNLHKEGVEQGGFCDVCFWRECALKLLTRKIKVDRVVGDFLLSKEG